MVEWWTVEIDRAIKITKARIKHHEKHGCGKNVMIDKACLQKQEHHASLRKNK